MGRASFGVHSHGGVAFHPVCMRVACQCTQFWPATDGGLVHSNGVCGFLCNWDQPSNASPAHFEVAAVETRLPHVAFCGLSKALRPQLMRTGGAGCKHRVLLVGASLPFYLGHALGRYVCQTGFADSVALAHSCTGNSAAHNQQHGDDGHRSNRAAA